MNRDLFTRTLELVKKKEQKDLAPEEEGELRGLFAHPDNPKAAKLVKIEHLASLGLKKMSAEECGQLRVIRAEMYHRKSREGLSCKSPQKRSKPKSGVEVNELYILHMKAKIASLSEKSWRGEPKKEIIDQMIETVSNDITVYANNVSHLMPKNEPLPLELYFLSKIRIRNLPYFEDIKPEGALRVMESVYCLRDRIRTKNFLLGIREEIQKLELAGKKEINLCDAGCGAIPIMAIYAALCSKKVRCTALELNSHSAKIAKQIIEALNLQGCIQVIQADATKFQPEREIDLLISETMNSGLSVEPMVQIMFHLSKYIKAKGVMLPSKVTVQAALVPIEDWFNPKGYVRIHDHLYRHVTPEWKHKIDYRPGDRFDEVQFTIPTEGLSPGSYCILITSEVDIGSQRLQPHESLITMPHVFHDSKDKRSNPQIFEIKGGEPYNAIRIQYRPGDMLGGAASVI